MVVTGRLLTLLTAVWQERTASPPMITVQAPQSPMPQPYLGPLMFNTSRSTHRRGISGGTSTVAATLLIVSLVSICYSTVWPAEDLLALDIIRRCFPLVSTSARWAARF